MCTSFGACQLYCTETARCEDPDPPTRLTKADKSRTLSDDNQTAQLNLTATLLRPRQYEKTRRRSLYLVSIVHRYSLNTSHSPKPSHFLLSQPSDQTSGAPRRIAGQTHLLCVSRNPISGQDVR